MLAVPARFLWNNRERDAENGCRRKLLAGDGGQEGFEARRPMSAPAPGPPRAGLAASGEALKWPAIALAQCFDISASIVPSFCPDSIRKFRPKRPAPQVIFKFPENFPPRKHQGSASGKRNKGCPEPPTKSPPNRTRGSQSSATEHVRREPAKDFRFQSAHIRKTPVLSELARTCKFAPSVFSFGPSTARFLFGKTKRKWGVDSSDKVGTTQPADWLPLQGIEFNKNTVQCIESGNRFVTDLELKAIAQVLGVTADELLSE